jgi:hypothetical protein
MFDGKLLVHQGVCQMLGNALGLEKSCVQTMDSKLSFEHRGITTVLQRIVKPTESHGIWIYPGS